MADKIYFEWRSMDAAPRDGSEFVVKAEHFGNMIVTWCEYADSEGGWWLEEEGAVIPYAKCTGWWPIPQ